MFSSFDKAINQVLFLYNFLKSMMQSFIVPRIIPRSKDFCIIPIRPRILYYSSFKGFLYYPNPTKDSLLLLSRRISLLFLSQRISLLFLSQGISVLFLSQWIALLYLSQRISLLFQSDKGFFPNLKKNKR